jgi:hypothetical protein
MPPKFKALILLVSVMLLSGCSSTLFVYNADLGKVESLFKDYVGLNGYQLTYQNDQTKSYRLLLGTVYIPHSTQTKQTFQGNRQLDHEVKNLTNLVAYEQTVVETVNRPAHIVEATAKVRMVQQNDTVVIHLETDGPLGTSVDDLKDFIQQNGLQVESR